MGRTERSIKNIVFGIGAQLITTLLTFISRTIMLKFMGLEVISLNGLFWEVIEALSLAELGIGSAIVYNLYKPLAEKDTEKVCQLMTFFKKAYHFIAVAVFALGSVVCVFVPYIVNDIGYPESYIRMVFMLFVVNISCSYLFSYKISLLNADQNSYLYSFYSSIIKIVTVIIEVAIMIITGHYIIYLVGRILLTLLSNAILSKKIDAKYPYLKPAVLPKEECRGIFDNVKNIFVKEVSGKITNSTDNILISTIISTIVVGKYTFYSTIIGVFKQFTSHVDTGIRASMGNLFVSGTKEDCERILYRLTWGYCAVGVFCSVCFFSACQSFICCWVGKEYLLEWQVVLILASNLFVFMCSKPIYAAMHVAGLFVEGRNISIIGSVVNLVVSIVFAQFTGLFGVFFGTFLTYVIQIVLKIHYVYKLKFEAKSRGYFIYILKFLLLFCILLLICNRVCSLIDTSVYLVDFLVKGIISAIICMGALCLCYFRSAEFVYYKSLAMGYLKKSRR